MLNTIHKVKDISFTLQRKARLKHTYIEIRAKEVLVKTNMHTSLEEIEELVSRKSAWILKHLKKNETLKPKKKIENGTEVYFLGLPYEIEIQEHKELKQSRVVVEDSKIVFYVLEGLSEEELQWHLDMFYKAHAIEKIDFILKKWLRIMRLEPTYVGYRKAKTRWGSCSSKDRISFNYYLMKLPLNVVEYVVVHELAHIEHKNHSKNFWSLVGFYLPHYKKLIEELRNLEKEI